MPSRPGVTVVIPTRNRNQCLPTAIASALGQEMVDVEVVVINDGSTDRTAETLADLTDPRLRHIHHETSQGQARARNEGIRVARGDWVAFLDDDDFWAPSKLCAQLGALAAEGALWGFTAVVLLDQRRRMIGNLSVPDLGRIDDMLLGDNVVPAGTSNVIVQTRLIRELGGFDSTFNYLTDWDLWIRLLQAGRPAVCESLLAAYVLHGSNLHMKDPGVVLGELDYLTAKHGSLGSERGVQFGTVAKVRWSAAQQREAGHRFKAAGMYARLGFRHHRTDMLARALAVPFGEGAVRTMRRLRARFKSTEPGWLGAYR